MKGLHPDLRGILKLKCQLSIPMNGHMIYDFQSKPFVEVLHRLIRLPQAEHESADFGPFRSPAQQGCRPRSRSGRGMIPQAHCRAVVGVFWARFLLGGWWARKMSEADAAPMWGMGKNTPTVDKDRRKTTGNSNCYFSDNSVALG